MRKTRHIYSKEYKELILSLSMEHGVYRIDSIANINSNLIYKWRGTDTHKRGGRNITSEEHDRRMDEFLSLARSKYRRVSMKRFIIYAKR